MREVGINFTDFLLIQFYKALNSSDVKRRESRERREGRKDSWIMRDREGQ